MPSGGGRGAARRATGREDGREMLLAAARAPGKMVSATGITNGNCTPRAIYWALRRTGTARLT
jgi:hypothetical protein